MYVRLVVHSKGFNHSKCIWRKTTEHDDDCYCHCFTTCASSMVQILQGRSLRNCGRKRAPTNLALYCTKQEWMRQVQQTSSSRTTASSNSSLNYCAVNKIWLQPSTAIKISCWQKYYQQNWQKTTRGNRLATTKCKKVHNLLGKIVTTEGCYGSHPTLL